MVYASGKIDRFCASLCEEGQDIESSIYCCNFNFCNNSENLKLRTANLIFIFIINLFTKFLFV